MNEQNQRRFVALLIDFFLISILYSVLINLVPESQISLKTTEVELTFFLSPDRFLLLSFLYFVVCDLANGGESLGKDIMGLQTRGVDGNLLDLRHRLYRTLFKMVSLVFWPVALLIFFWKERNLTLQDYMLDSSVLSSKRTFPAP